MKVTQATAGAALPGRKPRPAPGLQRGQGHTCMEGREGDESNSGFSAGPGGAGNESSLPSSPSSSSPLEMPSRNRGLGWRLRCTCCPLLLLGSCVAGESAAHRLGQARGAAVRLSQPLAHLALWRTCPKHCARHWQRCQASSQRRYIAVHEKLLLPACLSLWLCPAMLVCATMAQARPDMRVKHSFVRAPAMPSCRPGT